MNDDLCPTKPPRGYSTDYPVQGSHRYCLDIPVELYRRAQRACDRNGLSLRAVLLRSLDAWTARAGEKKQG
ncbi:MAG: hypothetical protein VW239_04130 [Candidatus Nanopelagicales bacterium]